APVRSLRHRPLLAARRYGSRCPQSLARRRDLARGRSRLFQTSNSAALSRPARHDRGHQLVTALRSTLERLVDFDRINAGEMRFSVGAVNIRSGNFVYFDSTTHKIWPEHIMASGALPPGCPAIEVDGELYWDGGLVSNTPLQFTFDVVVDGRE